MIVKRFFCNVAPAFLSGALLVLAYPKFDADWVIWFSLVPLLLALEGRCLSAAFALSYVTGLVCFSGVFSWVWTADGFTPFDYLLVMTTYVPHYVSLWGLAVVWIRRRTGWPLLWIAPPLWVAQEYARVHTGFLSAPGMLLGHTQYLHPAMMQICSVTGVYGLSFLIACVNAAIADLILTPAAIRRPTGSPAALARACVPLASVLLLVLGTALYGHLIISSPRSEGSLRVALVQANIPQDHKWDKAFLESTLTQYSRLTRAVAEQAKPELIIWPETAVPADIGHDAMVRGRVAALAREVNTPLLVGSSEYAKFTDTKLKEKYFNSMFLVSPDGTLTGQYRKMVLFPFGEYDPLKGLIAWPKAMASAMGNMVAGDEYTVFHIGPATFGATICFEAAFPDHFRELARRGAHFVVSSTNEAWFGDTAAAYHLLSITVFRAAEHRVAIVRAANSGLSAFIDPYGRITERLTGPGGKELFVDGVLTADVAILNQPTLYTKYGDVFALVLIALAGLLAVFAWRAQQTHAVSPLDRWRWEGERA